MDILRERTQRDTASVLDYNYNRDTILNGVYEVDTPLFDTLAADRFASDRFNLGDYR